MKWILFTGTWRLTNQEVEDDVRTAVRDVLTRGDGVVTGGGTGVDHFVIDELKKHDPQFEKLKVFIPTSLEEYIHDYRTNWLHAPITSEDIDKLEACLKEVKSIRPDAMYELPYTNITQVEYNLRHLDEVKNSDEVYAFQVNESAGTQDTINKSKEAGLPITLHKKYTIVE